MKGQVAGTDMEIPSKQRDFVRQAFEPPEALLDATDRRIVAELQAAPQNLLKLDLNRDGQLTPDEITPRPENAGANPDELVKQLMAFDKNGDGVLTTDELPARMPSPFATEPHPKRIRTSVPKNSAINS